MGFLTPKPPKPPTPANPPGTPIQARETGLDVLSPYGPGSLISTSPAGLKRKANTQKTSLIGG